MISVTLRIFGSSSTARMQWGEVREMSVIVIWVQSPVGCASGEYDPRTPYANGDYSVSGSVSVNLTDDCRELGGGVGKTSEVTGLGSGFPRNGGLTGHDTFEWRVENSEQSSRGNSRCKAMRRLG